MKKLFIFISLIFVFTPFAHTSWTPVSQGIQQGLDALVLPLRMARLYAQAPDQTLAMPIVTLQVQQVQNTWQANRAGKRLHDGQDLFAPRGTAVYSANEGYVVCLGENPLGGNTVSVVGAGGRIYYYAHLEAYAPGLSVGDSVTVTTILGSVGTTGNARGTPPHLHFGVYAQSGAINPLPLLTNRP